MKQVGRRQVSAIVVIGLLASSTLATAHTALRAPDDVLDKIGFDQQLGAQVPLDTVFRDAQGAAVQLGRLVHGKPALLVPGYYSCANLCSIVRAGVAQAVARSGLRSGTDFQVVLVSIDPHDLPGDASDAQRNDAAAHPGADVMRWNYLTGAEVASAALMKSIGFRYFFDPRNGQYDHAAGVVLLSPEGKVTQYLFGVQFEPETMRLALVNASQGRIGTVVDHFLLLCSDYDPSTGRYSLTIVRVMQGLGIATALALAGLIFFLRRRESNHGASGTRP